MFERRKDFYGYTKDEWFAFSDDQQKQIREEWWDQQRERRKAEREAYREERDRRLQERIELREAKRMRKYGQNENAPVRYTSGTLLCSDHDFALAETADDHQLNYIISTSTKMLHRCLVNEDYETCTRHQRRIDEAKAELLVRQLLREDKP